MRCQDPSFFDFLLFLSLNNGLFLSKKLGICNIQNRLIFRKKFPTTSGLFYKKTVIIENLAILGGPEPLQKVPKWTKP